MIDIERTRTADAQRAGTPDAGPSRPKAQHAPGRHVDESGAAAIRAIQRAAGNRATARLLAAGAVTLRDGTPRGAPVRRLMSTDAWKAVSKSDWTVRALSRVHAVDRAIVAYHALDRAAWAERDRQLDVIEDAAHAYLGAKGPDDDRRPGMLALLAEIEVERSFMGWLADATTAGTPADRLTSLVTGQDRYLEAQRAGHPVENLSADFDRTITAVVNEMRASDPEALRSFILADLGELQALAGNAALPDITRAVLEEVLANALNVHFEEWLPGATLSGEGVPERYTVKHRMAQSGGTPERLGSLAHELTHVSISETFGNTPLFLAFARDAGDQAIVALVDRRRQRIAELQGLLDADRVLRQEQRALVQSKLDYAKGNKLGLYAARFLEARKIARDVSDEVVRIAGFADNSVIEYDTVVNQMLVYMATWQIPEDNAFYAALREVATEAYEYRRAARG